MKTFAEIKDNTIVNVSVWGDESPQGEQFAEITGIPNVGIGWSYVDGQFVEPVQPEEPDSV
jgi:hypothetical protein